MFRFWCPPVFYRNKNKIVSVHVVFFTLETAYTTIFYVVVKMIPCLSFRLSSPYCFIALQLCLGLYWKMKWCFVTSPVFYSSHVLAMSEALPQHIFVSCCKTAQEVPLKDRFRYFQMWSVFPAVLKEFPHKLSTWHPSLPSVSQLIPNHLIRVQIRYVWKPDHLMLSLSFFRRLCFGLLRYHKEHVSQDWRLVVFLKAVHT